MLPNPWVLKCRVGQGAQEKEIILGSVTSLKLHNVFMEHIPFVVEKMNEAAAVVSNLTYFPMNAGDVSNETETVIQVTENSTFLEICSQWIALSSWMLYLKNTDSELSFFVLGFGLRFNSGKYEWNFWTHPSDPTKKLLATLLREVHSVLYPNMKSSDYFAQISIISSNGNERVSNIVSGTVVSDFATLKSLSNKQIFYDISPVTKYDNLPSEFRHANWDLMTTKAAFIPEHVLNELTSKLLATGISPMYNNMNSNYEGMNNNAAGYANYPQDVDGPMVSNDPNSLLSHLNLNDIQEMLGPFREFYTVSVVEECSTEYAQMLGIEGCPKCLQGADILHTNNVADAIRQHGPCIVLRCKVLDCQHVVHVACLFLNGPQMPSLHRYHCTAYFRVVPMHDTDPNPALDGDIVRGSRKCTMELEMSHLLSNAQILRIEWPKASDTSSERNSGRMGQEVLIRNLNPEKHRVFFAVLRARVIFKCVDSYTGEEFLHDANYSLEDISPSVNHLRLVLVDPSLRHTLTIGVRRRIDEIKYLQNETAVSDFYISYVRYDLMGVSISSRPIRPQMARNSFGYDNSQPQSALPSAPLSATGSGAGMMYASNIPYPAINSAGTFYTSTQVPFHDNPPPATSSAFRSSTLSSSAPAWEASYGSKMSYQEPIKHRSGYSTPLDSDLEEFDASMDDVDREFYKNSGLIGTDVTPLSRATLQEELRHAAMENISVPNPLDSAPVPTGIPELDDLIFGISGKFAKSTNAIDFIVGRVCMLAKSQGGSRFIQQKLEEGDLMYFQIFFEELKFHVAELMMDSFGHYAIEKLMYRCDESCRIEILHLLTPLMIEVACHKQGSFSIQAIMDVLHSDEEIVLLSSALMQDIVRVVTSSSGHFVILRFLQHFPLSKAQFVLDTLQHSCLDLAVDHYGLRILKTAIDIIPANEMHGVFKAIARLTMKLAENQYGNYCIQHVLDHAPPNVCSNIKTKMEGKFVRLAKQKFSSNVVEKCLRTSDPEWRGIILRELTSSVGELIRDRYGNYVLQTAVSLADASQLSEFTKSATPFLNQLRDNVRTKWAKILKTAGAATGITVNIPPAPPMSGSRPTQVTGSTAPSHTYNAPKGGKK